MRLCHVEIVSDAFDFSREMPSDFCVFDENRVEKDRKIQLQHGFERWNLWIWCGWNADNSLFTRFKGVYRVKQVSFNFTASVLYLVLENYWDGFVGCVMTLKVIDPQTLTIERNSSKIFCVFYFNWSQSYATRDTMQGQPCFKFIRPNHCAHCCFCFRKINCLIFHDSRIIRMCLKRSSKVAQYRSFMLGFVVILSHKSL